MKIEIDGKEVEIDNAAALAALKDAPEYNAELDRMRVKGEESTRTALTGEHTAALEALKAEQAAALETAGKLNSGEKEAQIQALRELSDKQAEQINTITESFAKSEANRIKSEKDSAKKSVEGKLIIALSAVEDQYNKKNITRDAMDAFDVDKGQFLLSTGVMGSVEDMVAEMQGIHADKFSSPQPTGSGITGAGNFSGVQVGGTEQEQRAARINQKFGKK